MVTKLLSFICFQLQGMQLSVSISEVRQLVPIVKHTIVVVCFQRTKIVESHCQLFISGIPESIWLM